ncbi:tRNA (adenosine(37)-N6)-dimethylallyltransferase MiaA [Legionella dresdenensis]|uniref:tRNA dimethylallyltransferase n=1 Tax=Legionella dresdenensis TaxID=450200 RepID=A0ABV8CF38_9GAMM
MPKPVFCLLGPTAAGKTDLACSLVEHFPFEIISVDSAMIYREMDIGTAKPSEEELARAPHHLLDILDPPATYSAAQFCKDTQALCQSIEQRGKIPLLVGGTMMYFNALQQGLSQLPEADEQLRRQLAEKIERQGLLQLHAELQKLDPISAARIHANDSQRIQRALEVYYLTEKPLSAYLAEQKKNNPMKFINFALFPEQRSWLHQRIAIRFQQMIKQGFVAEVEHLLAKWQLTSDYPSMRCVGYRQAIEYLHGDYDHATFMEKGIAATRQLAKRQLTWLRHWTDVHYIACDQMQNPREIVAIIAKMIDNSGQF